MKEQKNNLDETYKKWKSLVNMTPSELKKFYESEDGKEAGLSKSESGKLGIGNGRESARWILKMKNLPKEKWTPKMWEWANRQISFISRMSGNSGALYDEKGNKTRKHTSLLIWGHNPNKHNQGGNLNNTNQKENKMENNIGKEGLITDKKSLFKGQNCKVVKEQKRWYVCEVESEGKPKNVYVSKGGIKFDGAEKMAKREYVVKDNQYIPYKSNKATTYYYIESPEGKTINKNTGKPYKGKEMSNYKFETKDKAQEYANKLNGVFKKGGNINAKTKAKLLIISSSNPLSKQLIAEGFEQFNAIDYSEVKHANFNILTHNESKKTFVVYPERIYSQLDEDALQADVEFLKSQNVELVESFEQGGNVDSGQKHEYMMLSRLQSDCEYFLNHGGRSETVLWAGNVVDQIKEMKSLYNKLTVKPEWISMEDILEYEKKMKESYKEGGNIPNNYEGKTAEQVWDSWDAKQRYHFLSDHAAFIEEIKGLEEIESSELRKTRNTDWKKLEKDIKLLISNHVSEGQYAKGGGLTSEKVFEVKYYTPERLKKRGKLKVANRYIVKTTTKEKAIEICKKEERKNFAKLVSCKVTKMNPEAFERGGAIGKSGTITDKKSLFKGKMGMVVGENKRDYIVTVLDNGKERNVLVSKKGIDFIEEFEDGGKIDNDFDWNKIYEPLSEEEQEAIRSKSKKEEVDAGLREKNNLSKQIKAKGNTWNEAFSLRVSDAKHNIDKFVEWSKKNNLEKAKSYFEYALESIESVKELQFGARKYANALEQRLRKAYDEMFLNKNKGAEKSNTLEIEREIKQLENDMEKNRKDYEAAVERLQKLKGEKLLKLNDIKTSLQDNKDPQLGWSIGLNEEQIEVLCGIINRYGNLKEHPKATKETLNSFKYSYLKQLILEAEKNKQDLDLEGIRILDELKNHFNI